ncbi:MAG TPA: hypothetical protein VFL98_01505 [Candidatus Paceibacterota bacterium]|nr:hypothetical protein [Candidatus Paceibacterota bacterium]
MSDTDLTNGEKLIIPSIMGERFSDIEGLVDLVHDIAPWVQLDVMDGRFVGSTGWPYEDGQWAELEKLAAHGPLSWELPYGDSVSYEAHLMVAEPERVGALLAKAGVKRLIPHALTLKPAETPGIFARWREAGAAEIGISLMPDTPVSVIEPYAAELSVIQIMGITTIGRQGEAFDRRAIERIAEVHAAYPGLPISVDGGVNLTSLELLALTEATRFIIGSALFRTDNLPLAYRQLKRAANMPRGG